MASRGVPHPPVIGFAAWVSGSDRTSGRHPVRAPAHRVTRTISWWSMTRPVVCGSAIDSAPGCGTAAGATAGAAGRAGAWAAGPGLARATPSPEATAAATATATIPVLPTRDRSTSRRRRAAVFFAGDRVMSLLQVRVRRRTVPGRELVMSSLSLAETR